MPGLTGGVVESVLPRFSDDDVAAFGRRLRRFGKRAGVRQIAQADVDLAGRGEQAGRKHEPRAIRAALDRQRHSDRL